jgi:hypothetical protein
VLLLLLQVITQDRTGHREPVRGALYNATFGVVVSVDEGGTVCVWNLQVRCGWGGRPMCGMHRMMCTLDDQRQ